MSRIRFLLPAAFAAATLAFATLASAQSADPPDRVARLAYFSGDVQFAPAGESTWGSANVNRPLITGDRLLTGSDGRAALELGDAALRINDDSAFNFLELNDTTSQVELSQGALNLKVRRLQNGQTYEIDTPTAAFVASTPGTYRVDVDPSGTGAMVTVFDGAGTVYGENGASRPVAAGQSYRFDDPTLVNVTVNALPAPDDFDRFASARDSRYTHSVSRRYVSPDVIGYDDLDQYGDWQPTSDYGNVWYPNNVASDWTPYRDGHWAWIDPYGWTWVDNEPWGFAPFHYGRWAYVRDRWGWVPGPPVERAVYAPALVAFVGGSGLSLSINIGGGGYNNGYDNGYGGGPVGWFPLGPRDIYRPPYQVSRGYFNNVNLTNIRNVYVNKTVINNYYNGYAANPYTAAPNAAYAYRNNPRAFTVVPRNVFAGARPVAPAVLRNIKPAMLAKATVAPPRIAPTPASLGFRPNGRPVAAREVKAFDRPVVARHAPPPPPVPFAAREKLIAKQGGAPLPVAQLRDLRQARAKAQPQPPRVRLVQAAPKPGAAPLPPMKPVAQGPRGLSNQGLPNPGHAATAIKPIPTLPARPTPGHARITPIQAPVNPSQQTPTRPGELPSARFAHPQRNGNLPQPPAINPANPAVPMRGKPTTTPMRPAEPNVPANPQAPSAAPKNRENGFVHAPHAGPLTAPAANANANAQERAKADRAAQLQSRQAQQRADQARAQQQQAAQAQSKAAADQRAAQAHDAQARAAQQAAQQHDAQALAAQQRADQARVQQQQAAQAQSKAAADQRAAQQHDAQARAAQQAAQQHDAQALAAQRRADQARVQQQNASQEQRAVQARQQQQQAQQQADQARQAQQHASQEQAQQRAMQQQSQQRAAQEQQRAAAAQQQAQMRDTQALQAQQRAAQAQQHAAQMQNAPPQNAPQPQQRPPEKKHKDEQQQNGGNRR